MSLKHVGEGIGRRDAAQQADLDHGHRQVVEDRLELRTQDRQESTGCRAQDVAPCPGP